MPQMRVSTGMLPNFIMYVCLLVFNNVGSVKMVKDAVALYLSCDSIESSGAGGWSYDLRPEEIPSFQPRPTQPLLILDKLETTHYSNKEPMSTSTF